MAYGNEAGFTAWLEANGYTLPAEAPAPAVLLQRGSQYIDNTYGPRFVGTRTGGWEQERAWPRSGVSVAGEAIPDDVVPQPVINAAYEAAYAEAVKPGSLSATYTPGTAKVLTEVKGIKWEVIGDPSKPGALVPVLTSVEGLLAPLLTQPLPGILVVSMPGLDDAAN